MSNTIFQLFEKTIYQDLRRQIFPQLPGSLVASILQLDEVEIKSGLRQSQDLIYLGP